MIDLATALQLLALLPPLQFGSAADVPAANTPAGSGTLLIAACQPGEIVTVSGRQAPADADGVARLKLPGQDPGADPYVVMTAAGEAAINGALGVGEVLSGTCP